MRNKTLILILLILGFILVLLAYYIFKVPSSGSELTKVKIGYQALAGSWAFYVANEKLPGREMSFFEEEGLEVEPIRFDSSNTAAEALLRGDIITDSATTMTVLFNIEERSPGTLKCFGFQVHTKSEFLESFVVRKNSGIKSYSDLKNKKLGVFPGSLNQEITKLILKDYIDPGNDVEIIRMTPPLQLQAITLGQVDALISYEPTTSIAVKNNIVEVVEDSPWAKRIFEPFPVATYCLTTKFIQENPRIAGNVVNAWFKAIDYLRQNRTQASDTIPLYTQIDSEIAQKLNQPAQQKSFEIDREAVQKLADLYFEFGLITKKIDAANIYYILK